METDGTLNIGNKTTQNRVTAVWRLEEVWKRGIPHIYTHQVGCMLGKRHFSQDSMVILLGIELGHVLKISTPSRITAGLSSAPEGIFLSCHPGHTRLCGSCVNTLTLISAARAALCIHFRSNLDDSPRTWPEGSFVQGHRNLNDLAQSRKERGTWEKQPSFS